MLKYDTSPLLQAAVATFKPRQEEVVACESVTLLAKDKKPRILTLCVPSEGSSTPLAEGAVLYVALMDQKLLKPKMTLRISRLVDVQHAGMFDASFSFSGASVDVSFEAHLQRELFVAAVRRVQRDIKSGVSSRGEVSAYLTEAAEAEANADAQMRVKKLRQEKRRAFSAEEEERVLGLVREGHGAFDDMHQVQVSLGRISKKAELATAREISLTKQAWDDVREEIDGLNDAVKTVQTRIQKYSVNLLGKKTVIQQIESENNVLHRTLKNVEALSLQLHELHDRLTLDEQTLQILSQLSKEQNELVRFFANRDRARAVARAMKHMEEVLHDEELEREFPIAAMREQKTVFLQHRRMIVSKATLYALAIIEIHKVHYLTTDRDRFSGGGRVVWRMHDELLQKLEDIGAIIAALERINMENFVAVLRKYRASMQQVYTLEIRRFFSEVRIQVKKVGVLGQSLLGERDSTEAAMRHVMETGMLGETPHAVGTTGATVNGRATSYFNSPMPAVPQASASAFSQMSPSYRCGVDFGAGFHIKKHLSALRHSLDRDGSDEDEHGASKKKKEEQLMTLYVEVPELNLAKQRLQRPGQLTGLTLHAAGAATALTSRMDPFGSGCVRPDIMFAVALETVVDCILREECLLSNCFNIRFEPPPADVDELENEEGAAARRAREKEAQRMTRNELFDVSLKELFAGDAVLVLADADTGAPPPRVSKKKKRRAMNSDDEEEESSSTDSEEERRVAKAVLEKRKRNYIQFEMVEFAQFMVERCDRVYVLPMLCMVRSLQRQDLPSAKSNYCREMLECIEKDVLAPGLARYVAEQTESIERCGRKWKLRPHALLHPFAKLPLLLRRLDATINSLNTDVLDTQDYASVVMSFVDQSFLWLDIISHIRQPTEREASGSVVTVADFLTEKVRDFVGLADDLGDPNAIKKGYLAQYRHHAFFCAMLQTFPESSFSRQLLQERYDSSLVKRERYEELYLTRLILSDHLPQLAHFMLTAEDLIRTYTVSELSHHRSLSADTVTRLLVGLEAEVVRGVPEAAARVRKHFTRDVRPNTPEDGFHSTLLHVTWRHFVDVLLTKFRALEQMVATWPHLAAARRAGLQLTFTAKDVQRVVDSLVTKSMGTPPE